MTGTLTYSVREVAALLGQSKDAIYAAVRAGLIPDVGVGKTVRIPKLWIEQHFDAHGAPLRKEEPIATVAAGTFT